MQHQTSSQMQFIPCSRRSITPNSRALIEQNFQFGNAQIQQPQKQRSSSQTKVLTPHLVMTSGYQSAQISQPHHVQANSSMVNQENMGHSKGKIIQQQQQLYSQTQGNQLIRGRMNEIIVVGNTGLTNSNQATYRLKQSSINDEKSSLASNYQNSNYKENLPELMSQTCPSSWNLNQQQIMYFQLIFNQLLSNHQQQQQYCQNQQNAIQKISNQQQQQVKLQSNISKLLLENEKLNQILCEKDREFAENKKKLQQFEKKNETLKQIIQTHDKEVQTWQQKFEEIEAKFLKFVQENSSNKTEEDNKQLKESIAQLNKQNEDLNELIFKNIKSQINDSNEIKQLKTQIAKLSNQNQELNTQLKAKKSQEN